MLFRPFVRMAAGRLFALHAPLRTDDSHDFTRDDVAVRVYGNEKAAALEREADSAPRRCGAGRAA